MTSHHHMEIEHVFPEFPFLKVVRILGFWLWYPLNEGSNIFKWPHKPENRPVHPIQLLCFQGPWIRYVISSKKKDLTMNHTNPRMLQNLWVLSWTLKSRESSWQEEGEYSSLEESLIKWEAAIKRLQDLTNSEVGPKDGNAWGTYRVHFTCVKCKTEKQR